MDISDDRNKGIILPACDLSLAITVHTPLAMAGSLPELPHILDPSLIAQRAKAMKLAVLELPLIEHKIPPIMPQIKWYVATAYFQSSIAMRLPIRIY